MKWDNPAERPGVKVYRPKVVVAAQYDSRLQRVLDTSNGDYLALQPGHAGGMGQYTFGNTASGLRAYGAYRSTGGGTTGVTVFEVSDLRTKLGKAPKLARSEFDLSRVAELFRARMDAGAPNHNTEVIVVDSRPEAPSSTPASVWER